MAIGVQAQYHDTSTITRSVIPDIDLLSASEFPLLKLLSGGTEDRPTLNSLDRPCEVTKFEWIEDEDAPVSTTLGGAIADGVATTITLAASPASFLGEVTEGTVLWLPATSELLWVSSATGTTSVTVTRGFGGTTAAAASNGATVQLAGRAHRETAAAPTARYQIPTMPYNYVQQFVDTFTLTQIEQSVRRYGIDDAIERATRTSARKLMRDLTMAMFYSKRSVAAANVAGAMGGFSTFIPSANVIAGGSANLTAAKIHEAIQACYDYGGSSSIPDTVVVNSFNRRRLSSQFGATTLSTWRGQAERAAGVKVDVLITDFGDIDVLLDPFVPKTEAYLLKRSAIGIGPLVGNEFKREMLGVTGPQKSWMTHGAYTLQVRQRSAHAMINALTTS